jgi:hypothetical protein
MHDIRGRDSRFMRSQQAVDGEILIAAALADPTGDTLKGGQPIVVTPQPYVHVGIRAEGKG